MTSRPSTVQARPSAKVSDMSVFGAPCGRRSLDSGTMKCHGCVAVCARTPASCHPEKGLETHPTEPGGGDVSLLFSCPSRGRRNTPSGRSGPSWSMIRRDRPSGVQAIDDGSRLTLWERSGPHRPCAPDHRLARSASTRYRPSGRERLKAMKRPSGDQAGFESFAALLVSRSGGGPGPTSLT